MTLTGDDQRYIEYLQQQLLNEDWAAAFEASRWKLWLEANAQQLQDRANNVSWANKKPLTKYLEDLAVFDPETQYEVPTSRLIFESILKEVEQAAATLGISPVRSVRIFTSTDISASPAARPTTGEHILFAGPGTYSFCNYWAKCLTAVTMSIAPHAGLGRIEHANDLAPVFRADPSGLVLAVRLSLYYASFGTLLGFGEVQQQSEQQMMYRSFLLHAMETFAIAHEYAHFVAEEKITEFSGALDPENSRELEFFCDELGLVISRECGNAKDNYLAFAGIGALLTFRAIQLCEEVRAALLASIPLFAKNMTAKKDTSSHPVPEERIERIKTHLSSMTAQDQRDQLMQFVEEYDRIISIVFASIKSALEHSLKGIE